jgi:hypothetical protein
VIAACTAPIIGIFGEADHTVSVNKSYELKVYAGMPHGWFNDTKPGRYRQRGAEEAWFQIIHFLENVYAGAYPKDRIRWSWEGDISTGYDFSKNVRLE